MKNTTSLCACLILVLTSQSAFSQSLPQAPDTGQRWNALTQTNAGLPTPNRPARDFNLFDRTFVDRENLSTVDPTTVTPKSLLVEGVVMAVDATRSRSLPGGVAGLNALAAALRTDKKPETLMRIVQVHLMALGNESGAASMAAGVEAMSQPGKQRAVSYINGMARDLRKIGAIQPAKYLTNAANLVQTDLMDKKNAILDAATLGLRYGATPQRDLAQILSYNPQELTFVQTRTLVVQLIRTIGRRLNNDAYEAIAVKIERNATQDGARYIQQRIQTSRQQPTPNNVGRN